MELQLKNINQQQPFNIQAQNIIAMLAVVVFFGPYKKWFTYANTLLLKKIFFSKVGM